MAEYIYQMIKARKKVGDKLILDDVTMSFFPGAKIGMVGPNGAGKSTILKIMAGLDQPSNGDATLTPGFSVGILMQEPELDESKTVLENVQDGVGEIKGKVDRFNEISALMAEPDADFDALLEEMGKLQEDIDNADAWDLDAQLEQAMDALRTPPGDAQISHLSGGEKRRVALCKLLLEKPDLLLLDEPTNHLDAESVQWLEQHLQKYPGAVIAITHDRYFLDHVAEWIAEVDRGRLYPYEGNYSTYLEKKAERLDVQGKKDAKLQKRLKEELEWVPLEHEGAPGEVQGAPGPLRGDGSRGRAHEEARLRGDPDPTGAAARLPRDRGEEPPEGLRRPHPDRRPDVLAPAERHRRRDRPERRRQDDAVQDDRRLRVPRRRRSEDRRAASRSATSISRARTSTRTRRCGRSSPTGSTSSPSARRRSPRARTCRSSGSRGRISRRRPACCLAVSAIA